MKRDQLKRATLISVLTLAAVCAPSALAPAKARAWVAVDMNCTASPFNQTPSWASTNNTISVDVWWKNSGGVTRVFSRNIIQGWCNSDSPISGFDNSHAFSDVDFIIVTTNGDDAYWLDELVVRGDNQQINWGTNNTVGFCFSTDAGDGNNSKCANATAHEGLTFIR